MTCPKFNWKLSDKGKKMLTALESLSKVPYKDIGNNLTYGIGHLVTAEEKKDGFILVVGEDYKLYKMPLYNSSLTDIEKVFSYDLLKYEMAVEVALKKFDFSAFAETVPNLDACHIVTCKFDAMVMFVFNIGLSAFERSTLRDVLKVAVSLYDTALDKNVVQQMLRWNKVDGKVSKGLVNRRNAEVALYRRDTYAP